MIRKIALIGSLAVILFSANGCKVVEEGTVGISKSFGRINEELLSPGIHLFIPVAREVEVWNVKTQRRAIPIETPSIEGLMVIFEATVLFKAEDVVSLRTNIGGDYVRQVLDPTMKDVFRGIIGTRRVEEIFRNQSQLTDEVLGKMREAILPRGIEIQSLRVTGLNLPDKFRAAVEAKLEAEQRALQKEFELQQAKKDAEIEIARAEGAAKAQEIVQKTLSPNYLQYLWISTLNKNPNVIYVATEANMPVFRTAKDPALKPLPGAASSPGTLPRN